jgi:C1A family cysteine protease
MSNPQENNVLPTFKDQRIEQQIVDIQSQLEEVASADIKTMPEDLFVNVFLPLFAGDEEKKYKVNFAMWAGQAGSAYKPVNIVDAANKVLFTVPPLFDRNQVTPVEGDGIRMSHVIHTTQQYANMHPAQAEAYLNEQLSQRNLVKRVPANILNHLESWNAIFKRYGRPEILAVPEEAKNAVAGLAGEADNGEYEIEPL